MKSIFGKLETKARVGSNQNFYFENVDWVTQHWIKNLCLVIDEEIEALKKRIGAPLEISKEDFERLKNAAFRESPESKEE